MMKANNELLLPVDLRDRLDILRDKVTFLLEVAAVLLEERECPEYLVSGIKSLADDLAQEINEIRDTAS